MTTKPIKYSGICSFGSWINLADFFAEVKHQVSCCNHDVSEAPIIVVGDAELRNNPVKLKNAELS